MSTRSWIFILGLRASRVAILAYLGMVLLLAGCQRRFIYYPVRLAPEDALWRARQAGLKPWHDAGGELAGWRQALVSPADAAPRRRALVFHGNAGHALHRGYYIEGFESAAPGNWDVILFEYPGYGARSGRPSEAAIMRAAHAALSALTAEEDAPVYLVGESLGSGPACRLAGERPGEVAGLWLITPFTSLVDAARVHYPVFPVRLLLRERYDNVAALAAYRGPLAVLTAGHDAVVPARLGQRLYESAPAERKLRLNQPDADHNTLDLSVHAAIWSDVTAFWSAHEEEHHAGND